MSFDFSGTGSTPGLTGGDWLGAGVNLLSTGISNATNYAIASENKKLQEKTNAQNESLMRESWARDDNAVQRRVADLKAAGLSPVLAAGSAAGNSGPIQLNSPQLNYKFEKMDPLSALAAVQQVKGQVLDNQLKSLGVRYYGMPDWLIGIQRVLGEAPHDNQLRKFLEGALNWIGGFFGDSGIDIPPGDGSSVSGVSFGSNGVQPSLSSLQKDSRHFVSQMLKDGNFNSGTMFQLASSLARRYNISEREALDALYDAWDAVHGDY